jgi:hypothetical protein
MIRSMACRSCRYHLWWSIINVLLASFAVYSTTHIIGGAGLLISFWA